MWLTWVIGKEDGKGYSFLCQRLPFPGNKSGVESAVFYKLYKRRLTSSLSYDIVIMMSEISD